MRNPILTTTIAALLACLGNISGAQEAADVQPVEPIKPVAPVPPIAPKAKFFKMLGKDASGAGPNLFIVEADKGGKDDKVATQTSSNSIMVNTDGKGGGKAIITIEVNGKKETREIDLGNATEIKVLADEKKDGGESRRTTFLGVAPEELPEELAAQLPLEPGSGLLVRSIVPDSPAAAAGLQKNDVLVKLDDQALNNPKQLQKLVGAKKAGDTVRIGYFRRGQRSEIEAKLAEHEESEPPKNFQYLLDTLGAGHSPLRTALDPLTLQKKIIIMDKDGKVITKDDTDGDQAAALKRLGDEVERMRDQAVVAQKKAAEAIQHAERAAKEAAELARKEAATVAEQVEQAIKNMREQMEKARAKDIDEKPKR